LTLPRVQMLDVTTIAYMKFLPTLLAGSMKPVTEVLLWYIPVKVNL
jgi:hypothetical protein